MIEPPTPPDSVSLQKDLLAWFDSSRRDLPWRRRRSLYGTWISEMMLQQTTVATVVPYWERFMARFPDVETLAAATEEEVLALWSGLGYYTRARRLHAAARVVVGEFGGALPGERDGWRALPGIGDYAAGAIASMGLGQPVAAVDANARRVLLRLSEGRPEEAAAVPPRRLDALGQALAANPRPGDWNEALMELGALVCRSGHPACGACPVVRHCRAGAAGTAGAIPPPVRRSPARKVVTSALVLGDGHRCLLVPAASQPILSPAVWGETARSDFSGLHRKMWGPPMAAWYSDQAPVVDPAGEWCSWLEAAGLPANCRAEAGELKHAITVWRLEVTVVRAMIPPADLAAAADRLGGRAVAPAKDFALSSLARKILAHRNRTAVDR